MGESKMADRKKIRAIALLGLWTLLIAVGSSLAAADKLFIVTNQKALDLAKDFINNLNNESIPLGIVMDQFEKVKKEQYIIVLGGAKGTGSADDFVKQVLTEQEQQSGNQPGGKMFVKENIFAPGQVIIVFTGADEAAAADARKNNRKTWWPRLAEWFDLDTSLPMVY
jgi:hypothetical protein